MTPTVSLEENFTRLIDLRWIRPDRVEAARDAVSAATARIGSDELATWEPLPESRRENQTRFFLDSVRRYLGGRLPEGRPPPEGDAPGRCTALRWNRGLLDRFRRELEVAVDGGARRLNLEDCEIYLLESGVVTLVWEMSLPAVPGPEGSEPDLTTLAEVNHGLRYTDARRAPEVRIRERAGPSWDGRRDESFLGGLDGGGLTLPEMTSELLAPLEALDGELHDANDAAFKVQAYARVTGPPSVDGLGEELFLLRRVAKESFRVPERETRLDQHPDVLRTFDNVAMGVSLEGMAMLVVDTGHPFLRQLGHRARTSYFAHYLLALVQRAALQRLAVDAGRLPDLPGNVPGPEVIGPVRRLRRRAIDFNLRHRFSQVSTVTMYDRLYRRALDVLGIPRLVDEVRDEVEEMDEILHAHVEQEQTRRVRSLNYLLAVFGLISILLGLFGANLPFFSGAWVERAGVDFYRTPQFLVPTALGVSLVVGVVGIAVRDRLRDPGGWGR